MTGGAKTDFQALASQLNADIAALVRQRMEIDKKILSLKQSLRGIERYLEAERDHLRLEPLPLDEKWSGLREMGLTDAVRKIIEFSIEPLNAKEVRDQLQTLNYPKLPKTNPLAAIHAIMTRLEKNKEIRRVKGNDSKPAYEWGAFIADLVEAYEKEHPEEVPERWKK